MFIAGCRQALLAVSLREEPHMLLSDPMSICADPGPGVPGVSRPGKDHSRQIPAAGVLTPAAKITTPAGQPRQQGKGLVALKRRLHYSLQALTFILDRFMMLYMRSTIIIMMAGIL